MKKYRKRSVKKRYKKRIIRRRARNAPLAKKLPYFRHKCTGLLEVISEDPAATTRQFSFARFQYGDNIVVGHQQTGRFLQVHKNYEQYAVTGLSVEWIPADIVGAINPANNLPSGVRTALWRFEDVDTYDTTGYTDVQIAVLDTFKSLHPHQPHKVYRNNKPLASIEKMKWLEAGNTVYSIPLECPNSTLNFRLKYRGYGDPGKPVTVGYWKYTYYITFKGQAYS